jgi:hypothetical protein
MSKQKNNLAENIKKLRLRKIANALNVSIDELI